MSSQEKTPVIREQKGWVHCPSCTHTVAADVLINGKRAITKPGQKCPRCASTLDAAYFLYLDKIAA